jgi:hypothetical protein
LSSVAAAYRELEQASARLELIDRLAGLLRQTPDDLLPKVAYLCWPLALLVSRDGEQMSVSLGSVRRPVSRGVPMRPDSAAVILGARAVTPERARSGHGLGKRGCAHDRDAVAVRSARADRHGQPGDEEAGERADADRIQHGAHADGAAEQPPEGQHRDLDRGARQPDRVAPPCQPGHQPVARARPEPGADVQPGGDAVDHDPRDQEGHPEREVAGLGQHRERGVDGQADHDHVADGAHAGALPQRDPRQQHQRADADDDPTERQPGAFGEALVQHVPRVQTKARGQHQGHAHTEQDEARVEVEQAPRKPPGRPIVHVTTHSLVDMST